MDDQTGTEMTKATPAAADGQRAIQPTDELSEAELSAEQGEELPDREAMSLINANVAAPVNAAVALNALSDHSTATANATQSSNITQGN